MDASLELNLNCQIENHSSAQIFGFCIDENCKEKNKFACSECIFDIHSQHKLVKIKELNKFIQSKYKDYKESVEKEKETLDIYKKSELNNIEKIKQLKTEIINELEKKINSFIEDLTNKYKNLIGNNGNNYANLKEYEDFFIGNAAPIQRLDLVKLSEICGNIYKDNYKKDTKEVENKKNTPLGFSKPGPDIKKDIPEKKKLKKKINLEELNKEFENYIKEELSTMNNYIEENFLKFPGYIFDSSSTHFEWCEKTYSGYDFFYDLENNKMKGTKISSNGTMTILRAKELLEENYIYNIKFKIGLTNGGDFDVGIGTEKVGDSCWLRTKESLCLSNIGVMNLDINMDNSIRLRDNDIVDLEINTEEKKKYFKASINNKLVCFIDYDLNNVYIMAAMRNIGNSIEVLKYTALPI